MSETPLKPKRRLSNINFEDTGAHLALVHKDQGGPANGYDKVLVMKSLKTSTGTEMSTEAPATTVITPVSKVQQVKVTMDLPEYLRRFFNVWYDDAEVLAYMMGYREDPAEEAAEDAAEEAAEQSWIESRLASVEILKSLKEAADLNTAYEALPQETKDLIQKDQAVVEKALKKIEKARKATLKPKKAKILKNKENNMTQTTTVEVELEVIEKSKFDEATVQLQKAKADLQAVKDELEGFKKIQKETIRKARVAAVQEVISDETKVAVLFKALDLVESDETFIEILEVLKAQTAVVDKSNLFSETGVSTGEGNASAESAVAKLLKAKYKTNK